MDLDEPLPSTLFVQPEMLALIAQGLEPAQVIAARYGFVGRAWDELNRAPWFTSEVTRLKAHWHTDDTLRARSRLIYEDLAQTYYTRLKKTEALGALEAGVKWFAKMADLEPKQNAPAAVGAGFSITFKLDGHGGGEVAVNTIAAPQAPVVEGVAEEAATPVPYDDPEPLAPSLEPVSVAPVREHQVIQEEVSTWSLPDPAAGMDALHAALMALDD